MLLPPTLPTSHHHQGTLKKSGRKCESWQLMKGAMKCWLLIMTWFCTHQHTVAVVPTQDLHKMKPGKITTRMERGPRLYAVQGNIGSWKFLRKRESLFWGIMGDLGHIYAHIGSTDWTQEVSSNNNNKKKTSSLEGDRMWCPRESWRKVVLMDRCDKNRLYTCMEFSKNKSKCFDFDWKRKIT